MGESALWYWAMLAVKNTNFKAFASLDTHAWELDSLPICFINLNQYQDSTHIRQQQKQKC